MAYWHKLRKPWTGLHWWYRILTGTKYTFPIINQNGYKIYWKRRIRPTKADMMKEPYIPCTLLNWHARFIFWTKRNHFNTIWGFLPTTLLLTVYKKKKEETKNGRR